MTSPIKTALLAVGLTLAAAAGIAVSQAHTSPSHRYLVQRSFPKGALDGLDAAQKAKVNRTNAKFGVTWVMSFATPDKTKTYCVYLGPNEAAIRSAAAANQLPVDAVTEVPVTLDPK